MVRSGVDARRRSRRWVVGLAVMIVLLGAAGVAIGLTGFRFTSRPDGAAREGRWLEGLTADRSGGLYATVRVCSMVDDVCYPEGRRRILYTSRDAGQTWTRLGELPAP